MRSPLSYQNTIQNITSSPVRLTAIVLTTGLLLAGCLKEDMFSVGTTDRNSLPEKNYDISYFPPNPQDSSLSGENTNAYRYFTQPMKQERKPHGHLQDIEQ